MRWLVLVAVLLTACATPGGDRIVDVQGGVVITVAPPPPAHLGPAPEAVPANARVIVLRPGGDLDPNHLAFIERQPGYISGSARVEATYPRGDDLLSILTWQARDVGGIFGGPSECSAISAPGDAPENWGCGSIGDDEQQRIGGYGHTSEEDGANLVEVEHGPNAIATVVETADGTVFVVRPNGSVISYHEWEGPRPERITVFWADGTRQSETLNHG